MSQKKRNYLPPSGKDAEAVSPLPGHFFERVLFRRHPVTRWQKAGLESKHREK